MHVVIWGTYDLGKPRNRILLRGLRENGVEVVECHTEVWSGIEDKSEVKGLTAWVSLLFRWFLAYPGLIIRYLREPKHDAVLIGYMGLIDVLVIWPFARLRGAPIVWDAFLSLYDTVVHDRKLVGVVQPAAWLLFALEWLACRAASLVILDTRAHSEYFTETFRIAPQSLAAIPVGVEPEHFPPRQSEDLAAPLNRPVKVLFYGQFIPLHGIDTIVEAARLAKDEAIDWVIIGRGQEAERLRVQLAAAPLPRLTWVPWVDYQELKDWIYQADLCLGIFGDTDKAARVIPNKIYQVLSAGLPLVTRDSPAIREILDPDTLGLRLVSPADPEALFAAVRALAGETMAGRHRGALYANLRESITPRAIGQSLIQVIERLLTGVTPEGRAAH